VSDPRAEAARHWLTRSLSDAMGSVPKVALYDGGAIFSGPDGGEEDDHDVQPQGDGGILAFEAVAALPPAELERWRTRFELARRNARPQDEPEPAAVAAAQAHMRALEAAVGAAETAEEKSIASERRDGALSLLLHVGLVEMDIPGIEPDELARHEPIGDPEHVIGAPLAVIPVPLARHDRVCLTCVELHERGIAVHWHAVCDEHPPESPTFTVSDGAGTRYGEDLGGGGSWSPIQTPFAFLGRSEIAGAPPSAGGTLTIETESGAWQIPLPPRSADPQ
jgi:hypothetical protein